METTPKPLNILILLNRVPYPLNDGGAIGAYNFIKGYAGAGCNITMLAMNTSKHRVAKETINRQFDGYGKIITVFIDNRIKPFKALLNLFTSRSYVIERFISNRYQNALIDILKQQQFDVVHVDGLPPAAYIPTIRQYSSAKISMRAHNVEHVIWQRIATQEHNPVKKWYVQLQAQRLKKFELNAIDACNVVMAISAEDENTIKKCLPSAKTIIVPAGMDIDTRLLNQNFNPLDLFFIGSFDWMPNLQGMEWFVDEVWPLLVSKFPGLKITVAGKKMPQSVARHSSSAFIAAGQVPDAKTFMLQHGLMVVPIVSGSGIRIKILEGMALGKTIIATSIAAEGLGLTNGENILIADSPAAFAEQIERCSKDPSFCRQLGQAGHQFVLNHYLNTRIFEKLVSYYRTLA